MSRRGLVVAGLVLAMGGAFVLGGRDAKVAAPPPRRSAAEALVTRLEQGTVVVPLSAPTMAALGESLAGHLDHSNQAAAAIADARAGRIDAVELGVRLHDAVAGRPQLGRGLLADLAAERSPELALQLALTLGTLEDDATLRAETVATLRATPAARAVGLLALLGRGEPEVLDLAAESFAEDSPEARATAGFLLNNTPGEVTDDALESARAVLADAGASARLREEAATLLGRKDATDADVDLLEGLVFAGDVSVRARALAALEATGVERGRLQSLFQRVAAEAGSPEPLTRMATAYLAANR